VDKADANPERVKRELSDLGLMPEAWGGTTVTVEGVARQKKNLEQLLEMLLLVADLADLKANVKRRAVGTVLESKLDRGPWPGGHCPRPGRDPERGRPLHRRHGGRQGARAVRPHGPQGEEGRPSTPVEVLGLSALPLPGDTFQVIDDQIKARRWWRTARRSTRNGRSAAGARASRSSRFRRRWPKAA
jgi:translation initiation factor IF-2